MMYLSKGERIMMGTNVTWSWKVRAQMKHMGTWRT